ncbi:MAG: hypothetical protein EP334_05025, partial [Gammaproteobacteria bacterium]
MRKKDMRTIPSLSLALVVVILGTISGCRQLAETAQIDLSKRPSWKLAGIQQTFKVSSVLDSGPGTLREAIQLANKSPGPDKIIFTSDDNLYAKPQSITLKSALPEITGDLLINGYIDNMLWKASGITIDCAGKPGIQVAPTVTAKIQYLTLSNCVRKNGGAIANQGILVLSHIMLMSNQATSQGGAIFNVGHLQLINSTLYSNKANDSGGAIYSDTGSLIITHATISQNTSGDGVGVFTNNESIIRNSILFGSQTNESRSGSDCVSTHDSLVTSVQNIIGNSSYCGEVFSSSDPRLAKPGYFNGPTLSMPITTKSQAFNWADNSASLDELGEPLSWDQRGNGDPRYACGIADIGAFEIQPKVKMEVDTLSNLDIRGCTSAKGDCSL